MNKKQNNKKIHFLKDYSLFVLLTVLTTSICEAQSSTKSKAESLVTIKRLNLKSEKEVKKELPPLVLPEINTKQKARLNQKSSPPMIQLPQKISFYATSGTQIIKSTDKINLAPPVSALQQVPAPTLQEPQLNQKNLIEIKPDEYKMIQALIFLDYKKKYDLAMSLFVDLMENSQYKSQALYLYAHTANGLKLYSEFRQKMIQVVNQTQDNELKKMAVEALVKNIKSLEISDIGLVDPLSVKYDIPTHLYPAYLLKKAKYHSERAELSEFEAALSLIPADANEYKEGSLLKAVLAYRRGQVDQAIAELENLWPVIESNKKDQIRNLASLTLARLYFQKADYKAAYKYYVSIDKSSGQWLQSMVEQAWTQVLAGDNEGAAGNMFALHTDYFKNAYAPDTYIVRTVGYLNLCQYGDGLHVLDSLVQKYKIVQDKLVKYQTNNTSSLSYYDLVKNVLKHPEFHEIEGVPRAFVVEMAGHPSYTNIQKQINNYEDENSRFNKITIDLIRKERDAKIAALKAKTELFTEKQKNKTTSALAQIERKFLARGVEHVIYSRARAGIKKMREAAVQRLAQEEANLRNKAGENLKNRYAEFMETLNKIVDQKEVLSYEIYSGAGEHLRFQMAGGEISDRTPASLNEEQKNNYKWKFRGEVWDDEIGHYRSSLKNVCPQDEVIAHSEQPQK